MSDSLTEYVGNLLRQGYAEQQIRQTLAQSGYPQSMVDAAFAALRSGGTTGPAPAQQTPAINQNAAALAAYLRTYLAQGYQVEQLRPVLLQQGYNATDVDAAIAATTGQATVRHEVHLPIATVAKVAFLLIIVGALFLGFGFIKGMFGGETTTGPATGTSKLLDVSLTISETDILPGDSLRANAQFINKGNIGKYDITIRYDLIDSDDTPVWSSGDETKAITKRLNDTKTITIPADTIPGKYTLKVTADYHDAAATASKPLTIEEPSNAQTPTENPDDETPPRGSTGSQGPIIIVEDQPQDTTLDDATAAARRGDSAKAEKLCSDITNQARHDSCLGTIALNDRQPSHCLLIIGIEEKETCLMPFIMEGKYDLCAKLVTKDRKDLCENLKHLSSLQKITPPPATTPEPDIGGFATPT